MEEPIVVTLDFSKKHFKAIETPPTASVSQRLKKDSFGLKFHLKEIVTTCIEKYWHLPTLSNNNSIISIEEEEESSLSSKKIKTSDSSTTGSNSSSSSSSGSFIIDPTKVKALEELGFNQTLARNILRKVNNDLEQAANKLLVGDYTEEDLIESPPPKSSNSSTSSNNNSNSSNSNKDSSWMDVISRKNASNNKNNNNDSNTNTKNEKRKTRQPNDETISQLVMMGFDSELSRLALKESNNDFERAIELLLTGKIGNSSSRGGSKSGSSSRGGNNNGKGAGMMHANFFVRLIAYVRARLTNYAKVFQYSIT